MKTSVADYFTQSAGVLALSLLLAPALAAAQPLNPASPANPASPVSPVGPVTGDKEPSPAAIPGSVGSTQDWCALPLCRDAEALRRTGDLQGALKLYRYIQDEVDVDEKVVRKQLLWFTIAALYSELQQAQAGLEALQKYQLYAASIPANELPAGQRPEDTERLAQELRARQARVRIGTTVPGLRVRIDGKDVGVTPFETPVPVPVGRHRVVIGDAPGAAQEVEVAAGQEVLIWPVQSASRASALTGGAVDTNASREPRPRWRVAVGSLGLGIGVVLGAVGAAALATDGQCVSGAPAGPCPIEVNASGQPVMRLVDGRAVGGGLLAAGILLSAAGTVLIALPGKRLRATVAFHSGATLGLAASF